MTQVRDPNSIVLKPTVLDRLGVCFLLFAGVGAVVIGIGALFDTSAGPDSGSPAMMPVFGALLCFLAVRWWRGWYSTIYLDWTTRAVMIHRRPSFFGMPREARFAPGELHLAPDFEQRTLGRGGRAAFARIELYDRAGTRVFKYTAAYDNRWRGRRNAELQLLAYFFRPTPT